jgi:hypothetical protein
MKKNKIQPEELMKALTESWSVMSSSKWSRENPAKGQCGVTALVVNDLLGGEIKKTKLTEGWHFYNYINGKRYDFTASQFGENITYVDAASNRQEAFSDTNAEQYRCLKQKVWTFLHL